MTIYLNEPKNGEKIKTYGVEIRHDGRFYYAAVFPCILENDGNPAGYLVTSFTLSAYATVAEKRLNKKTLERLNRILFDYKDYLKPYKDPESLARESAHLCM